MYTFGTSYGKLWAASTANGSTAPLATAAGNQREVIDGATR